MEKIEINQLNEQFGIANQLSFSAGLGGLPFVQILNNECEASISLHGGQILQFIPTNQAPVLWTSKKASYQENKAIRGGIPVCWPWFGPHPVDSDYPAHGFARVSTWKVVSTALGKDNHIQIRLGLDSSESGHHYFPFKFHLEMSFKVGKELEVELLVRNTGFQKFTFTAALHSYFAVKDVSKILIHGLKGTSYLDSLDSNLSKTQDGPIFIGGEIDRIYFNTTSDCIIEDPGLNRKINIAKSGSKSTVIWNPWIAKAARTKDFGDHEYQEMVCVETTNADDDKISLDPSEEHCLNASVRVEPLN